MIMIEARQVLPMKKKNQMDDSFKNGFLSYKRDQQLYITLYAMYIMHYTLYYVQYTLYNLLHTLYIMHFVSLFYMDYEVYIMHQPF